VSGVFLVVQDQLLVSFLLLEGGRPGVAWVGAGFHWPVMISGAGRGVWPGQVGSRKLVESDQAGGDEVSERCVCGQLEPGASGAAGDTAGDGEQSEAEPFGFPDSCWGAGQGQHLHPRVQFGCEHGDRDPDLILREIMQGQVSQPCFFGVADAVLAAGAAPVSQFEVREFARRWCSSRTR
jgi:hypothetical protein